MMTEMRRDVDYAADAVQRAILEKFGREVDLSELSVDANVRTISVQHGERTAESTRDRLLAAVRDAKNYQCFWELIPGL